MAWCDDGEIQAGGCTYIASSTDPSRSSTSPSRRVVQPEAEWVSILPLVGKPFLLRTHQTVSCTHARGSIEQKKKVAGVRACCSLAPGTVQPYKLPSRVPCTGAEESIHLLACLLRRLACTYSLLPPSSSSWPEVLAVRYSLRHIV